MYCCCCCSRDQGDQIFGVANIQSYDAKDPEDPESLAYESVSVKEEEQLSTTQQQNVKPIAKDHVNIEDNPSYLCADCSDPQEEPATEDKLNAEEKYCYVIV